VLLSRFRSIPLLLRIAALGAMYVVVGKLGLQLATAHPVTSPIWPATGLALGALILFGVELWPGIFLAAFLLNFMSTGSVGASLGIAAGNTLEAVIGSYLVRRFAQGPATFEHPQSVFAFTVLVAFATSVSATLGATSLSVFGQADWDRYPLIWLTWWLGDLGGALIVAPVLILWASSPKADWEKGEAVELCMALGTLLIVAEAVYGGGLAISRDNYPLQVLVIPPLLWSAVRLKQRDTAAGMALLSAVATYGTLDGYGPFASMSVMESLLLLQSFLMVLAVTAFGVGAAIGQHREAEQVLRANEAALADREHNIRRLLNEAEDRERELRDKQQQLVQAAKLASIGELATGIAHELNNPLNNIALYVGNAVDYLLQGKPATTVVEHLQAAMKQVERGATIINHLRTFGRAAPLKTEPLPLHDVVLAALSLLREQLRVASIEVTLDLCAKCPTVLGNRIQLEQVFLNLLSNAKDAVHDAELKTIHIATRWEQDSVTVVVEDTGQGIPSGLLPRIFDPFFTTKAVGQGTGLGLSITYAIVREHKGNIVAENNVPGGMRFIVELPVDSGATTR
jgi:signal transduction histidine kinase